MRRPYAIRNKSSMSAVVHDISSESCQRCHRRRPLAWKGREMICGVCANPNLERYRMLALQRERSQPRPSRKSVGNKSDMLRGSSAPSDLLAQQDRVFTDRSGSDPDFIAQNRTETPKPILSSTSGAAQRRNTALMYLYLGLPIPPRYKTSRSGATRRQAQKAKARQERAHQGIYSQAH